MDQQVIRDATVHEGIIKKPRDSIVTISLRASPDRSRATGYYQDDPDALGCATGPAGEGATTTRETPAAGHQHH